VLPAAARLTRRTDFERAVRRGRRAGRARLVVHACTGGAGGAADVMPRIGFVVGRNVGGSVVRHRVQRRLRHVLRDWLGALPPGTLLVVRALPLAAGASSAELASDVDSALRRLELVKAATADPADIDEAGVPCAR
jgi:ribonuclease P protein component